MWLLALSSCREPYTPSLPTSTTDLLVVDGFINSQGSTLIKLSRTNTLAHASDPPLVESKATVYVQDDAGARYPLNESTTAGTYTSVMQTLNPARQYQLRITTKTGKDYASDLVPVKTTPPIDQLSWKFENDGVQVYLDAHDATRNTTYYRWTYEETWSFNSAYYSNLRYQNGVLVARSALSRDSLYTCWRTLGSTAIRQTTTLPLSQDAVRSFPLTLVPKTSEKLRIGYSILVQQHGETAEEYAYWDKLRKNTENVGSLYDALPTQLTGNVHCLTDASEPVLGFVGAHSVTEMRLLVLRNDLPKPVTWVFETGYEDCLLKHLDEADRSLVQLYFRDNPTNIPVDTISLPPRVPGVPVPGFRAGSAACIDCRLKGTHTKPSYWP